MKFTELSQRIQKLRPDAACDEIARLCLLLINSSDHEDRLDDENHLKELIGDANIRFQMATDQHAAVTEELEGFEIEDSAELTPEQVGVLARSIKIQNQLLQFYVCSPKISSDSNPS